MSWDWQLDMQNVAVLGDGTLVTVLILCQGDRWQNWIMDGLNMSMASLNAFASTDQGETWVWPVGAPRRPLHVGRLTGVAPRGPLHGGVADLF